MSFGNTQPTDPELVEPPTDSISCVKFSPNAPILAVGSWNNEVCPRPDLVARRSTEVDER
jgi:hypothetical protein